MIIIAEHWFAHFQNRLIAREMIRSMIQSSRITL
jgi:hypothetical protein